MYFIEWIKSCYDIIAHKSKFGAKKKVEARFQKHLADSETGFSFNLFLRDPCSASRAQINETAFFIKSLSPYSVEFYNNPVNAQAGLKVAFLVQETIKKSEDLSILRQCRFSGGVHVSAGCLKIFSDKL